MKFRQLRLVSACVILSLSVVFAFPVVGYFAYLRGGVDGVKSAGVAALVCWVAATAALLVSGSVKQSPSGVAGILLASALRFGLPLAAAILLQSGGGNFAEAGFLSWIVLFYLITLAVETTLSLLLQRNQNQSDGRGIATNG